MKWVSQCQLIGFLGGTLGVLLLAPNLSARGHKEHPYRYSDVDIPVSLAVGTARTPEFAVKHEAYFIMIQAEKKHLSFLDLRCMMGVTAGPLEASECTKEPILKANWTVLDGEHIVAHGTNRTESDDEYTDKYLFKFLGKFMGETDKKYIVEVKFTKDGSSLNVTNPHLIVILVRRH